VIARCLLWVKRDITQGERNASASGGASRPNRCRSVGPRPHALSHNREYERKIALYARRRDVLPGITGWAQVNGFRGETDTDEKMKRRACGPDADIPAARFLRRLR
jgi:hypothetical protein